VRAQAGLDRVDQQQRAVRARQLACGQIELARHRTARVALAHDRLQEHRLDEPAVAIGIGEDQAQLRHVVGLDRDQAVLVPVAGQMLDVGLAAGVGERGRAFGAAVERALDREALDRATGVARARVGHALGIDVGDAARQRHRLGAGIEAEEARVRRAAAAVADLAAQRLDEAQLAQARRHHVGHDLPAGQGRQHRRRRMAEAEHAVAARVVHDGALERDQPRPARGQRDVRVDRVVRIEIDEAGLDPVNLLVLVEREEVGHRSGQLAIGRMGRLDRLGQFRMARGEGLDEVIGEAGGPQRSARLAHLAQLADQPVHSLTPRTNRRRADPIVVAHALSR